MEANKDENEVSEYIAHGLAMGLMSTKDIIDQWCRMHCMNYNRCRIKRKRIDMRGIASEVIYSTDCIEVLILKDRINDLQRNANELQKQLEEFQKQGEDDEIRDN